MSATNSRAALISINDAYFGPNSAIRDTATNSDWLNLNMTNGLSRYTLTSLLATPSPYYGWHFATMANVKALFDDADVPPNWFNMTDYSPSNGYSASDLTSIAFYNSAVNFINMMGVENSSQFISVGVGDLAGHVLLSTSMSLHGIFDSSPLSPLVGFTSVEAASIKDLTTGDILYTRNYFPVGYGITADEGGGYYDPTKTYLVRDSVQTAAVPEPSTFLLFVAGAVGIVFFKRGMSR